jgi:hypothetical protein
MKYRVLELGLHAVDLYSSFSRPFPASFANSKQGSPPLQGSVCRE